MARVLKECYFCTWFYRKCVGGSNPFTLMDIFLTFISIGSFLADIGTDIIVIIQYYRSGNIIWMLLTTILVCVPSLIVQIFSIRWYIVDGTASSFLWLVHVFQLGVFQRYIKLLQLGIQARKNSCLTTLKKFQQQQSDICMLRLFESFMESAPQLVLQLYIMVSTNDWNPWTGISAVASIFSLSWGIAVYSKAMRNVQPGKNTLSWWGLLFQSLWRIGMVSSRVLSMVIFTAAYGSWLVLIMGVHWFCMTIWVFLQNTDFCTTLWEERLYNCVVGVIYCFCYFNVKEGQARYRMSVYYALIITQNLSFVLASFSAENLNGGLKYLMILSICSGIVIGIISLLLYYCFFHPSGPVECLQPKLQQNIQEDETDNKREMKCNCCTLKTCRKLKDNANENVENCIIEYNSHEQTDQQLERSNISINSPQDLNISCSLDLHRSHSLNCSSRSYDLNKTSESLYHESHFRRSVANHHRNVNYHFRPAAYGNLSASKIHCSCLVLLNKSDDNPKNLLILSNPKHYKSLPNLDISSELNNVEIKDPSPKMNHNVLSCSNINTDCEKEVTFHPKISNDHVLSCSNITMDCEKKVMLYPKMNDHRALSCSFINDFGKEVTLYPKINSDHVIRITV